MYIKIISDGTVGGTSVVNSDTGEKIKGIYRVDWSIDNSGQWGNAVIYVNNVELNADVQKFEVIKDE